MATKNDLRRKHIEDFIKLEELVSVETLSQRYNVSLETVRKDLTFLENKGKVYRTHGGARCRNDNYDMPMDIRTQENNDSKKAICLEAIKFIKDDDVIYLDASSSVLFLGKLLRLKKNLTIVTASYELIPILSVSSHKIIIVGGEYLRDGKRITGEYALMMLNTLYFDSCFLSLDGCKNVDGPCLMGNDELLMFHTVLSRSKTKLLLSDSSKFEKTAHYQYANFSEFDILITDAISKEDENRIHINTIINLGGTTNEQN